MLLSFITLFHKMFPVFQNMQLVLIRLDSLNLPDSFENNCGII